MLVASLLALFVVQVLSSETRRSRMVNKNKTTAVVDSFPWASFADKTGIDPLHYLEIPAKEDKIACTTKPGPDRLDCPAAIAAWSDLVDDTSHISIKPGQCRSATKGNCRTVVCCPTENSGISVLPEEIQGRMWNPLSTKCVFGGKGGIWQMRSSVMVIEIGHPDP
ncbi:hypothetical protein FZEAL_6158 [Fusarium zealandicum]|uniref:Hydrophobin n=1 Tax=Fusarium zealandicum TaxID=1053134 RepID=A0A8H4UJE0_9HYPO|nr:hypothetical protein FZEAL_6158 [Fusarium zealandicum]